MLKRKLVAGSLMLSLVITTAPGSFKESTAAEAAKDIVLDKCTTGNPIGGYDTEGNLIYGGDPAVLVDGDTVYMYQGHDASKSGTAYEIPEWQCYSTKDLVNWKYEGVIMKADKKSIPWAKDEISAWAGQVAKHYDKEAGKDRYYFYHCTWDATSSGKQSIGVAVSDSPTGSFVDKGEPLVKGDFTTKETSGWNDIDPTVWIETDDKGEEHRYLNWGNGKNFSCELNEDMMSIKDINGDGQITFGYNSKEADVIEMTAPSTFTEAPWIYRRKDADGKYYGKYYLFYAYGWREQMAYATTDNLLDGKWEFGSILMPPAATSNTNHMAVFDFGGKTYFIYHNGSLPGGNGYRRTACITEVHFNEDGSVQPIPETATGISGTASKIYTSSGAGLSHETFVNSSDDKVYPYKSIIIGENKGTETADGLWVIRQGKADKANDAYVSIESENKPGLYITVDDDGNVSLAQDTTGMAKTARRQTFRTVQMQAGKGVSFESVHKPGNYLSIKNGVLALSDGSNVKDVTFYMDKADVPGVSVDEPQEPAVPGEVVSFKGTAKKAKNVNSVKFTWKKAGSCDGYELAYSQKKAGSYTKIKDVSASKTSYTYKDKKLKSGKTYYFRIRSYSKSDDGKVYSQAVVIKVKMK